MNIHATVQVFSQLAGLIKRVQLNAFVSLVYCVRSQAIDLETHHICAGPDTMIFIRLFQYLLIPHIELPFLEPVDPYYD